MAVNVPGVLAVLVFYLLVLGTGLWAARRARKVERSSHGDRTVVVLLGDRSINLLVGVFTMTATWVGGGFILGVAEAVYTPDMGLVWALMPLQYSVSFIIGGLFFTKPMRDRKYVTLLDPFQRKYGRVLSAALVVPCLLMDVLWVSCTLLGLGSTMSVILDLSFTHSVWISALVAVVYTLMGGLYSVAYTDVIQLGLTFLGLWLCVPFLLLNDVSVSIADSAFNRTFSEPWVGTLKRDDVLRWLDDFLMLALGSVSFQSFQQRALSASSARTAQLTCYISAFVIAILGIPPALVGAVAASTDWNRTAYGSPAPYERGEQAFVLPLTLQNLTPPFVSIIGIGTIAAAVMSSTDSSLLSATSVFSSNIYKNILRPKASDREMQWVFRVTVVLVGVVGSCVSFSSSSTLLLWLLGADVSYTLIFPHLVSVLYFPVTNGYGAGLGLALGLVLRLLLGESSAGLPAVLCLPGCELRDGLHVQKAPVRTVTMLCTLLTVLTGSWLAQHAFDCGLVPPTWDVFQIKGGGEEEEEGGGEDDDGEEVGVALQSGPPGPE